MGLRSMAIGLAAMAVGGCANFGMGGMSVEQIKAAVQDKSSAAACTEFTGTGGQFRSMIVNNDKTFNTGGGRTTIKCAGAEVTFEDAGKAAPAAPTPSRATPATTSPTRSAPTP